jgi:uncharacterized protein (TIGR02117 family)
MTRRWIGGILLGLAAPFLAYVLSAVLLGLVGVNGDFVATPRARGGVQIFLRTNGWHAEVVLPTDTLGIDWSADFPARHMRALTEPAPWLAFGWGDRQFMLATPTWHDVRPRTAIAALSGTGSGAMHVEYVVRPEDYAGARIEISADQYRRLAEGVRRSFRRDSEGKPVRIAAPGYFEGDAFYEAVRGYSPWFTCNEWVRRLLSDAGLPAPAWSPFERTLFWHLPPASPLDE